MAIVKPKPAATGHTAGIFADMTLDGPEVGTLVAVIDRAKNLPNRRTIGKQDPYCAMRLGKEAKKTDTDRRGGQTPKWDQEIRFTVHDSPDYYKLKCSVFNDDKKTDLIGEVWIDLTDLIKPGGGSNDLWHQLNYKGKYAGDIRIELTYYDIRPREEKPEKKKSRESTPTPNEKTAPRQLGPREVRRRPLPSSPAPASPLQTPPIQPPNEEAQLPPALPPKIPLDKYTNNHHMLARQQQDDFQYRSEPHGEEYPIQPLSLQHYRQPFCEDVSPGAEYDREPYWDYDQDRSDTYQVHNVQSDANTPLSASPHSWSEAESWDQTGHSDAQHYSIPNDDYYSSSRTSLTSGMTPHDSTLLPIKSSASPIRPNRYRDSPLRHSYNHEDDQTQMYDEPESFGAPPPPPMHRATPPRRPQAEYPPSSFTQSDHTIIPFAPKPLSVASKRRSIDDRSALQRIEQDYNPQTWQHESHDRRNSFNAYEPEHHQHYNQSGNDCYESDRRKSSYHEYQTPNFSGPQREIGNQEQQYTNHASVSTRQQPHWQRSSSYDDRRLSGNVSSTNENGSNVHMPVSSQTAYYKPEPIRPRTSASPSDQIPLRKAVSTELHRPQEERRFSADPYGPDAYDVLNPASSPVTNEGTIFQTAKQARESARMRNAEKIRDQGPIIGNDGREIDPSDHLPSDTWAPEPEKKTRRPEHVIHIRSKNDNRLTGPVNHSPITSRTTYQRQMPGQSPQSPQPTSPSGHASNNRNRLQKLSPVRSLPAQPYQQATVNVKTDHRPLPRSAEHTPPHQSSPHSSYRDSHQNSQQSTHRPHLSEYQVPASNSYQPRGYHSDYVDSMTTSTQPRRDYYPNMNMHNDPLAAEMSMIDIGPGRSGQLVLSRRAY